MSPNNKYWIRYLPKAIARYFDERYLLQLIAHNGGWLLLDKFIRMILGLIVSSLIARELGVSNFGQLTFAVTYITFFYLIANLGIDGVVIRQLVQNPLEEASILGTAFVFRLISGLICFALGILGVYLWYGSGSPIFLLVILVSGYLIFQPMEIVGLWFESQNQASRSVAFRLTFVIAFGLLKIGLVLLHSPVTAFAAIVSIDTLISGIAFYVYYKNIRANVIWIYSKEMAKNLIKYSWPFTLSSVAIAFSSKVDIIILQRFHGDIPVAFFGIAQTLSLLSTILPSILFASMLPLLSKLYASDSEDFYLTLRKMYRVTAIGAILIFLISYIAAPFLISFVYGDNYLTAATLFRILVFGNIFTAMGIVQGQWIFLEDGNKNVLIQSVASGVFSLFLYLIFIPSYGAIGSAWVMAIVQATTFFLSNALLQPQIFKYQIEAFQIWKWDYVKGGAGE